MKASLFLYFYNFYRWTLVQFRALCPDPVLSGFLPGLLFKISTFGIDFYIGKILVLSYDIEVYFKTKQKWLDSLLERA